jgi:hypothetical protein
MHIPSFSPGWKFSRCNAGPAAADAAEPGDGVQAANLSSAPLRGGYRWRFALQGRNFLPDETAAPQNQASQ